MLITRDTTVPGLHEAKAVQNEIKRLGIPDVELFFDPEIMMWGVCQVRQQNSGIVTMDNLDGTKVDKYLMWWIKDNEGKYRVPSQEDVHNVVATVRRAERWFQKGGDKLADELEEKEHEKTARKKEVLKERLAPHLKSLKKAIREELG